MAVFVDDAIWNWQGLKWCHLLADDIDELHRFAARLGVYRSSYQGPPKTRDPHYDLTSFERARALAFGATRCSRDEIVAVLRMRRGKHRRVEPVPPPAGASARSAAPSAPVRADSQPA